MPVSQLGDNGDRVQSGVLGERGRDDFERLSKGLEAVRFLASQSLAILSEQSRDVNLGCTSSRDQCSTFRDDSKDQQAT